MILAQHCFDGSWVLIFRCIFLLRMLGYAWILFLSFSFVAAPGWFGKAIGYSEKGFLIGLDSCLGSADASMLV